MRAHFAFFNRFERDVTMNWYFAVLKNYVGFSGRARRKEFWMFMLFHVIASFVFGFIDGLLGMSSPKTGLGPICGLYILATFLPGLAVQIRRLHNTNRSGWFSLIGIIPYVGPIIVLVLCAMKGTEGDNDYGEDPLESEYENNGD